MPPSAHDDACEGEARASVRSTVGAGLPPEPDGARNRPLVAVLRLTAFAALVALITTRIGLVVHELVGHGATANAVGAGVEDVRLFLFAGGWIRYARDVPWQPAEALAVQLGGIALQLVIGTAVVLWARRRPGWLGVALVGAGAGWAIHAAAYLAIGTWHGYGDGVLLHRALGDARAAVAVPAGAIAVAITFVAARTLLGRLEAAIPVPRRAHRVLGVVAAVGAAAAIHGGLAAGELALRRDTTYGAIMRHERDRTIDRELAAWLAQQRARGPVDPDAVQAERRTLERRHRTFPFGPVLVVAIALAAIAGAVKARRAEPASVSGRALALAAIGTSIALALVVIAGAVFPL